MKPTLLEDRAYLFAAILLIASILLVAGALVWGAYRLNCYWRWSDAYETSFGLGGCKVKIGDRWFPEMIVRQVQ